MAKKCFNAQQDKRLLGKLISQLRINKSVSLRQMAQMISIPPSNLTYIEDGRNVPTADVYSRIVGFLNPSRTDQKKMDDLYIRIRHTPPPDVCNVIIANRELGEKIKILQNVSLTADQLTIIEGLFVSFKKCGE